MGIDAYFETEKGAPIGHLPDPDGLLERLLPSYDSEHSICLRFIATMGYYLIDNITGLTPSPG